MSDSTTRPVSTSTAFTIDSAEGLPIRGDLLVPAERARGMVVVVHGFKGFKDWGFFPWVAERLCEHRLAVCRFNMSRSGVGEAGDEFDRLDLFEDDTYSGQIDDLLRVVRFCREHPRLVDLPLFLLGHSRGGGVALLAANEIEELSGVVTWSAISTVQRWDGETRASWRQRGFLEAVNARTKQVMRMSTLILDDVEENEARLDIIAAASRLTVPLLVLHGGRDESVPVEESKQIADASPDASRLVIANASHTWNAIHPLVHLPKELVIAAEVSAHFAGVYAKPKRQSS